MNYNEHRLLIFKVICYKVCQMNIVAKSETKAIHAILYSSFVLFAPNVK